ncbi:hypothetical protein KR222_004653 [Zaprionus bogoriensis]|nr:hypothetical protein KR222_004653 [Zaprionus bogoriensis]
MAPRQWDATISCVLLLLQLALAIRIEERTRQNATTGTSTGTGTAYRVSRPEPQQPTKRVPAHLQDIRPGYVDDDAGDVIRIIEPPQHFQQLKRLRQRQQPQPQPQPHIHKQPQHVAPPPPQAVIWEQPRKVNRNHAPATAATAPRTKLAADLLTQESQHTQHTPQLYNGLQLPMEILASVRKTERLLQAQRQQLPQLRQRHIQRQTHTLIAQKSLEQQLYQREQQQRLRATLSKEHKRSKRVKREAKATPSGDYGIAQGLRLVAHLGELLQNATRLLPDETERQELAPQAAPLTSALPATSQLCGNATNCDRRRRRQRLFQQTAVRGRHFRHEATATTTQATSSSTTSATPLASRLVNSRKSPNNRNQQQQQQQQQHLQLPAAPRHDDAVLYADVMSNIRNLWQQHDLAAAPQFVAPDQVQNNSDYRALHVYLHELDVLAKNLAPVSPLPSLNQQEFARATPPPSWYLINNEGKIYETRLDSGTKPTAALFHQFPDMPEEYEPVTTQDLE